MEGKIKQALAQLEKDREITILMACETGSRAWGFPSPDSDYDVRIIYKHPTNWYLSLTEEKDTIELFLENNEIDISGWDLRKTLRLLWKSNPPLMERIQSPIIYAANPEFQTGIRTLAQQTYSRIATMHHYLSMAKKGYDEVTAEKEYKFKKFFYALRASVTCFWILEKEEIPPIEFHKTLEGLSIAPELKTRIAELVSLKAQKSEAYFHSGEEQLIELMASCIARAEEEAKSLPAGKGHMERMNEFFRNTLE